MNDEELNLAWNDSVQAERAREYTPTSTAEKKIRKIMADDAAQITRTESYYKQLKKDNPKIYLDPKFAVQMHNDAQALGEAYFDGDA